jgi:hypothetical protein
MQGIRNWLNRSNFLIFSSWVLGALVYVMSGLLVGSISWFLIEQLKLQRRARRMGLGSLPAGQQRKLAKQLGFYDDLILSLERRQILRPVHLTPKEFSESITFVPSEAYDAIRRVTEIFYKVRYGRIELTSKQQKHLDNVVRRIDAVLGHSGGSTNRI